MSGELWVAIAGVGIAAVSIIANLVANADDASKREEVQRGQVGVTRGVGAVPPIHQRHSKRQTRLTGEELLVRPIGSVSVPVSYRRHHGTQPTHIRLPWQQRVLFRRFVTGALLCHRVKGLSLSLVLHRRNALNISVVGGGVDEPQHLSADRCDNWACRYLTG